MTSPGTTAHRDSRVEAGKKRGASRRNRTLAESKVAAVTAASSDQGGGSVGKSGSGQVSGDEKLLTTGEMARLSKSTLRTVRFYEEEGILRPARRTEGGHRLFRRTELDRLLFVTDLRSAGLSLEEIKEILDLKGTSTSGAHAAKTAMRIFTSRIKELQEKVAVLARLRDDFVKSSDIVSACLVCNDQEGFPHRCASCAVMTSHRALPRSTRVVWSVGAMPLKSESIEGSEAKSDAPDDESNG